MIDQKILNHFPCWIYDLQQNPDDYWLILSDDMDSLMACSYLNNTLNVHIGGFYDFSKGLFLNQSAHDQAKKHIFVDVACAKDGYMCFDNHRTIAYNHMAVNPNLVLGMDTRLNGEGYYKKYCGSSLLLVAALYGISPTHAQSMKLLAADSFYLGYYGSFRHINEWWLTKLGLDEVLAPVLSEHSAEDFKDFIKQNRLQDKLYIDPDGQLRRYSPSCTERGMQRKPRVYEGMPVKFSSEDLVFVHQELVVTMEYRTTEQMKQWNPIVGENIFSAAETKSGKYVVSIADEGKSNEQKSKDAA